MIVNLTKHWKWLLILIIVQFGCKSYNVKPNLTAEKRIELARVMFKNKDYVEAKTQYKILTLNNPGLQFIDEAQFFLGECHFNIKEYILAADEYSRLTRLYPKSSWVDDAYLKIALCNYKLSPKPALDQKYTKLAVFHFSAFIEDYPNSELVPEAERLLKICRTKLAEKEFKAGVLYRKLDINYAALVYFDSVLENYYDTKFARDALFLKGESLYELDRKIEADEAFKELISKYPKSKHVIRAKSRIKAIRSEVAKVRKANGISPSGNQQKKQP